MEGLRGLKDKTGNEGVAGTPVAGKKRDRVRSSVPVVWKENNTPVEEVELVGESTNCSEAEFWDYIEVMTQVNQGSPEMRVEVQGVSGRFQDDIGGEKAGRELRVSFVADTAV